MKYFKLNPVRDKLRNTYISLGRKKHLTEVTISNEVKIMGLVCLVVIGGFLSLKPASARMVREGNSIRKTVSALTEIVNRKTEEPELKLHAAVSLYKLGERKKAKRIIDRFSTSEDAVIRAWVAWAYYEIGEEEKALELIDELRELDNPEIDEILDITVSSTSLREINHIAQNRNNYRYEDKVIAINNALNLLKGIVIYSMVEQIYAILNIFAEDEDPNIKIHLAKRLSQKDSLYPALIPLLNKLAGDNDWQVRYESYEALRKISEQLNTHGTNIVDIFFTTAMLSGHQSPPFLFLLRPVADNLMGDFSIQDKVTAHLLDRMRKKDGLIDEEPVVRLKIVELLTTLGVNSQIVKNILEGLKYNDSDPDVRDAALRGLATLQEIEKKAKEDLQKIIALPVIPEIEQRRIFALGGYWLIYGFKEARDELIKILKSDSQSKLLTSQILSSRKDEEVKTFLLSCILNNFPQIPKDSAILGFAHEWWMEDEEVRKVLADSLNGEHNSYSFAVAYELIKFGNEEERSKGIDFLIEVSKDDRYSFRLRSYAILILGDELP
jgi:HEAT repeat protein